MECVELVANRIIGDVGAVCEGRDSKGLAKWAEGVVGGIAMVEGVVWFIERVGWRKQGIEMRVG